MYTHVYTHGGRKGALNLLELECFWNIWLVTRVLGSGVPIITQQELLIPVLSLPDPSAKLF